VETHKRKQVLSVEYVLCMCGFLNACRVLVETYVHLYGSLEVYVRLKRFLDPPSWTIVLNNPPPPPAHSLSAHRYGVAISLSLSLLSEVHTSTLYICIQIYIYKFTFAYLYILCTHTHTHKHSQNACARTHTCMDTEYEEDELVSRTGRARAGGAAWAVCKSRRSDSDIDFLRLEGGGASGVTGVRAVKLAPCKRSCMSPPPPPPPPSCSNTSSSRPSSERVRAALRWSQAKFHPAPASVCIDRDSADILSLLLRASPCPPTPAPRSPLEVVTLSPPALAKESETLTKGEGIHTYIVCVCVYICMYVYIHTYIHT
jgi:hypothetical protein